MVMFFAAAFARPSEACLFLCCMLVGKADWLKCIVPFATLSYGLVSLTMLSIVGHNLF